MKNKIKNVKLNDEKEFLLLNDIIERKNILLFEEKKIKREREKKNKKISKISKINSQKKKKEINKNK